MGILKQLMSVPIICSSCRAKYWDDDNAKRQQTVREHFPGQGLPDVCVNNSSNTICEEIHCPFKLVCSDCQGKYESPSHVKEVYGIVPHACDNGDCPYK